MISGAVLPMQSFPGDVCGLRVSQLICIDQWWLRLSSCLSVCMFCVQRDYMCNHKTFQRSIITSWPHLNQIWWSRSSWSDTWCASPWSCFPWTWARPTWRTRCPRGSSSGTPGALSAQKVTKQDLLVMKNFFLAVGRGLEEDLYGSLYDNIFLRGHIGWFSLSILRI